MKTFFLIALTLTALVSLNAAPPSPEEAKLQQELLKEFQSTADLFVKGDLAASTKQWADDFHCIDSFGVLRDKPAMLEFIKSSSFESWKVEDVKARLLGNIVVAVTRGSTKGRLGGVDVSGSYLTTNILINREGKWLTLSSQYTRIAKP